MYISNRWRRPTRVGARCCRSALMEDVEGKEGFDSSVLTQPRLPARLPARLTAFASAVNNKCGGKKCVSYGKERLQDTRKKDTERFL